MQYFCCKVRNWLCEITTYKPTLILQRNRGNKTKREYKAVITKVLECEATVNAESTEEEEFIDEEQYYNQKHILDESNLTERSFKVKIK